MIKKTLLIIILLAFLLLMNLGQAVPDYNFTFTGGSNESFGRYYYQTGTADFSNNDFRASSTGNIMISRNISLSLPFNVTMRVSVADSHASVHIARVPSSAWEGVDWLRVAFEDNDVSIMNNTGYHLQGVVKACSGLPTSKTYTAKVEFMLNGTVKVYRNDNLSCEGVMMAGLPEADRLPPGADFLVVTSRKSAVSVDDVAVYLPDLPVIPVVQNNASMLINYPKNNVLYTSKGVKTFNWSSVNFTTTTNITWAKLYFNDTYNLTKNSPFTNNSIYISNITFNNEGCYNWHIQWNDSGIIRNSQNGTFYIDEPLIQLNATIKINYPKSGVLYNHLGVLAFNWSSVNFTSTTNITWAKLYFNDTYNLTKSSPFTNNSIYISNISFGINKKSYNWHIEWNDSGIIRNSQNGTFGINVPVALRLNSPLNNEIYTNYGSKIFNWTPVNFTSLTNITWARLYINDTLNLTKLPPISNNSNYLSNITFNADGCYNWHIQINDSGILYTSKNETFTINTAGGYTLVYNFTDGSDEGFDIYYKSNAAVNPDFTNNDFRTDSTSYAIAMCKNVSLTTDWNFTVKGWYGSSYFGIRSTNRSRGCYNGADTGCGDAQGNSYSGVTLGFEDGNVYFHNRTTGVIKVCNYTNLPAPINVSGQVYTNGTVYLQLDDGRVNCSTTRYEVMEAQDDYVCIFSRRSTSIIDDFTVSLTGEAPSMSVVLNNPADGTTHKPPVVLNVTPVYDFGNMNVTFINEDTGSVLKNYPSVANGGSVNYTWSGLLAGRTYNWSVNITAADGENLQSETWSFTTPVLNNNFYITTLRNGLIDLPLSNVLNATFFTNYIYQLANFSFRNSSGGELYAKNDVVNNTPVNYTLTVLDNCKWYNWILNITAGGYSAQSSRWFKTWCSLTDFNYLYRWNGTFNYPIENYSMDSALPLFVNGSSGFYGRHILMRSANSFTILSNSTSGSNFSIHNSSYYELESNYNSTIATGSLFGNNVVLALFPSVNQSPAVQQNVSDLTNYGNDAKCIVWNASDDWHCPVYEGENVFGLPSIRFYGRKNEALSINGSPSSIKPANSFTVMMGFKWYGTNDGDGGWLINKALENSGGVTDDDWRWGINGSCPSGGSCFRFSFFKTAQSTYYSTTNFTAGTDYFVVTSLNHSSKMVSMWVNGVREVYNSTANAGVRASNNWLSIPGGKRVNNAPPFEEPENMSIAFVIILNTSVSQEQISAMWENLQDNNAMVLDKEAATNVLNISGESVSLTSLANGLQFWDVNFSVGDFNGEVLSCGVYVDGLFQAASKSGTFCNYSTSFVSNSTVHSFVPSVNDGTVYFNSSNVYYSVGYSYDDLVTDWTKQSTTSVQYFYETYNFTNNMSVGYSDLLWNRSVSANGSIVSEVPGWINISANGVVSGNKSLSFNVITNNTYNIVSRVGNNYTVDGDEVVYQEFYFTNPGVLYKTIPLFGIEHNFTRNFTRNNFSVVDKDSGIINYTLTESSIYWNTTVIAPGHNKTYNVTHSTVIITSNNRTADHNIGAYSVNYTYNLTIDFNMENIKQTTNNILLNIPYNLLENWSLKNNYTIRLFNNSGIDTARSFNDDNLTNNTLTIFNPETTAGYYTLHITWDEERNNPPVISNINLTLVNLLRGNQTWSLRFNVSDPDMDATTCSYLVEGVTPIPQACTKNNSQCSATIQFIANSSKIGIIPMATDGYDSVNGTTGYGVQLEFEKLISDFDRQSILNRHYFKEQYNITSNSNQTFNNIAWNRTVDSAGYLLTSEVPKYINITHNTIIQSSQPAIPMNMLGLTLPSYKIIPPNGVKNYTLGEKVIVYKDITFFNLVYWSYKKIMPVLRIEYTIPINYTTGNHSVIETSPPTGIKPLDTINSIIYWNTTLINSTIDLKYNLSHASIVVKANNITNHNNTVGSSINFNRNYTIDFSISTLFNSENTVIDYTPYSELTNWTNKFNYTMLLTDQDDNLVNHTFTDDNVTNQTKLVFNPSSGDTYYKASLVWTFSRENMAPTVTQDSPLNGSTWSKGVTIHIQYTATDDGVMNCTLLYSANNPPGVVVQTSNNITTSQRNYTITESVQGTFYWRANCTDSSGQNTLSPVSQYTILPTTGGSGSPGGSSGSSSQEEDGGQLINYEVNPRSFKIELLPEEFLDLKFNISNREKERVLVTASVEGDTVSKVAPFFTVEPGSGQEVLFRVSGTGVSTINLEVTLNGVKAKDSVMVKTVEVTRKTVGQVCKEDADCLSSNCEGEDFYGVCKDNNLFKQTISEKVKANPALIILSLTTLSIIIVAGYFFFTNAGGGSGGFKP